MCIRDRKEIDDTFSALRYQLSKRSDKSALDDYMKLKADADRRDWLAKFVVDPSTGGSTASSGTTVTKRDTEKEVDEWLTEKQLGGPQWLNDPYAAKILCESGDLEDRPHRYP
eukprot:7596740-Pyramimonas_sp.AAC.1